MARHKHKPPHWAKAPGAKPPTHAAFATSLLVLAGAIATKGAIGVEEVGGAAADVMAAMGWTDYIYEPPALAAEALGLDATVFSLGAPEIAAAVFGLPLALLTMAEGLALLFATTLAPILIALLAAMYVAHNTSISIGPWSIRLGVIFDPLVSMLEGAVRTVARIMYEAVADVVRFARVALYAVAVAMGIATVATVNTRADEINAARHATDAELRHKLETVTADFHEYRRKVNSRLDSLESHNQHVRHELYTAWGAVHDLQKQVQTLESEISKPGPKVPVTAVRIQRDERRIAEVETVTARIQHEIDRLHFPAPPGHGLTDHQAKQLAYADHVSTVLAPLMYLAPFSALRLRNLLKLSDEPCQCPQAPPSGGLSVPDPLADALIADLIIQVGV